MRFLSVFLLLSACFIISCETAANSASTNKESRATPAPPPTGKEISTFVKAALNGNTSAVSTALENGMPVNQKDANGNTALMAAAFNGHKDTMQVLIDSEADVNLRVNNGVTPLMAACGPYPQAVRLLLENGADVNATDRNESFTALMYASVEGLSPVVDILLEYGADPTMADEDNDTAADFARQRGFKELADKLQKLIDQQEAK